MMALLEKERWRLNVSLPMYQYHCHCIPLTFLQEVLQADKHPDRKKDIYSLAG